MRSQFNAIPLFHKSSVQEHRKETLQNTGTIRRGGILRQWHIKVKQPLTVGLCKATVHENLPAGIKKQGMHSFDIVVHKKKSLATETSEFMYIQTHSFSLLHIT